MVYVGVVEADFLHENSVQFKFIKMYNLHKIYRTWKVCTINGDQEIKSTELMDVGHVEFEVINLY